jgi:hypothetical protein
MYTRSLLRCAVTASLSIMVPVTASAQSDVARPGRLVRQELTTTLPDTSGELIVRGRLTVRPEGNRRVPLSLVLFDAARLTHVGASINTDEEVPAEGFDPEERRVSGTLVIGPYDAAREEIEILMTYVLRMSDAASADRVRIPILAPTWPAAEAKPGTFVLSLRVPDGKSVYDATPSLLREIDNDGDTRTYGVDMQVVPSLVSFSVSDGDPPLFGTSAILDTVVVVLLAAFSWVGWRHFQKGD